MSSKLNSNANVNSLFVDPFGFSTYTVLSTANHNDFTFSFPGFMPFFSFFMPWKLTRNYSKKIDPALFLT